MTDFKPHSPRSPAAVFEWLSMRIGVAYLLVRMFWPFILTGALIATAPWIITYTIWSFK